MRALLRPLILLCASGCTTTIIPPPPPSNHATVYLLDHGRTPSLVLPRADGTMTRYAYGDWRWYAQGRIGVVEGLAAFLLPTRGALGRGVMPGPATLDSIEAQVEVGVDEIHEVGVERAKVEAFHARMDDVFRGRAADLIVNEPYGLEFVPSTRYNALFHNSNHAVAGWLRELGCRTRGLTLGSTWSVRAK